VKLLRKERVGSRVRRRYDAPHTPLERVLACPDLRPEVAAHLQRLRDGLDPFALARRIAQQLERIYALANSRHRGPRPRSLRPPCLGRSGSGSAATRAPTSPLAVGNIGDSAMIPASVTFLDGSPGPDRLEAWQRQRRAP